MSLIDGCCDFCGGGYGELLSTGDELSVVFTLDGVNAILWDGRCREGSKQYFRRFNDVELIGLIGKSVETLENDPIQWNNRTDDQRTHIQKIWIMDEIERGKRELVFRMEDKGV